MKTVERLLLFLLLMMCAFLAGYDLRCAQGFRREFVYVPIKLPPRLERKGNLRLYSDNWLPPDSVFTKFERNAQ